jgi:hypothetical protein
VRFCYKIPSNIKPGERVLNISSPTSTEIIELSHVVTETVMILIFLMFKESINMMAREIEDILKDLKRNSRNKIQCLK